MRIMPLIRKYASSLALIAVLLGMAAAPYLIPVNPDSAVFRSGMLGFALLLACFFPLRETFTRASGKQLLCGIGVGLLFSIALSLGSELYVYDGLLPGMGSMLRRLAVPCMAAPLFGGLTARLLQTRITKEKPGRIPFWGFMAVLLICWLPLLLAYYPGALSYDLPEQFGQAASGRYSDYQPVLHTLMFTAAFRLGDLQPDHRHAHHDNRTDVALCRFAFLFLRIRAKARRTPSCRSWPDGTVCAASHLLGHVHLHHQGHALCRRAAHALPAHLGGH